MSDHLPAPVPPVSEETRAFWDATSDGRLMLPRCQRCGLVFWYPRMHCPDCWSSDLSWFEASGRGTIHTFSIVRRGLGAYAKATPYVLAYVELDEGPCMMTNIVECDPEELSVGQPVTVRFDDTGEGPALPRFRPAIAE